MNYAERMARIRERLLAEDDMASPEEYAAAQKQDALQGSMDRASDALRSAFTRRPIQRIDRGPGEAEKLAQRDAMADKGKARLAQQLGVLGSAEEADPTSESSRLGQHFLGQLGLKGLPEGLSLEQQRKIHPHVSQWVEQRKAEAQLKATQEKEARQRQEELDDMRRREEVQQRRDSALMRANERNARITAAGANTAIQTKIQAELNEEKRKANIIDFTFVEPMAPPTPDDAKKVKEAAAAFAKLRVAAEALTAGAAKYSGVTDFARLSPNAQKEINSLHQNLTDQYRVVAGLGVPNNQDFRLMARAVDDPGEFWNIVMGTGGKATDTLLQANRGMLNAFAEQYGYRYTPGATLSAGAAPQSSGTVKPIGKKTREDGSVEIFYDDDSSLVVPKR